jgi:hypothetical protein
MEESQRNSVRINLKCYIFYFNVKILFFIILTNNLFLPYMLRDFLYEAQKNIYAKEIGFPGWGNVTVWRDSKPLHVLKAI